MYRVGGMYTNVDLLSDKKNLSALHHLGIMWRYCLLFVSNTETRLC